MALVKSSKKYYIILLHSVGHFSHSFIPLIHLLYHWKNKPSLSTVPSIQFRHRAGMETVREGTRRQSHKESLLLAWLRGGGLKGSTLPRHISDRIYVF